MKIKLTEDNVKDINSGVSIKVDVDEGTFGADRVLIIGLFPGTADAIEKLVAVAEKGNLTSSNVNYIQKMNNEQRKNKVGERGESKIIESTYNPKSPPEPASGRTEETMSKYLNKMRGVEEKEVDGSSE